jgi:glycosyltransferase involved in cell wall biosynthesis
LYQAAGLRPEIQSQIDACGNALKILFVSHYNYYRNFETLIRALPEIKHKLQPRGVKLLLTCKLATAGRAGPYRTDAAARLIRDLGVDDLVVQLGPVPYRSLVNLYRQCDLYVSPAYAESFAHPLVEAMATGVPVVASDIAVHREICGDAALYFDRFSPRQLAKSVTELVASPELIARNRQSGWERARQFSWKRHVDMLVFHAQSLLKTSYERAPGGLSERVPQDFRHVADANCGTSR